MNLLIAVVLLVIAAETTYLVVSQNVKVKHSKKQHMPIFVDTSVLIDGRIVSVAASGFVTSTLYIPRSVVGELQFLADNADSEKRSRARHGLDIVKELQALTNAQVELFNDGTKAEEGVDNRLLKLAKEYNGAVCTIDYNLNKVAQVEKIPVLNVNDLAKTLRMAYLPGEKIKLELTQKGNDPHQGVGHLEDGTMVVVEHASSQVGKIVEIEFIRGLQTAAGKMMFARLVGQQDKDTVKKTVAKSQSKQTQKLSLPRKTAEKRALKQSQKDKAKNASSTQDMPVQQTTKKQSVQPKQQAKNTTVRPQSKRRRTPEDSLFELLDKQE